MELSIKIELIKIRVYYKQIKKRKNSNPIWEIKNKCGILHN